VFAVLDAAAELERRLSRDLSMVRVFRDN
jgi:hypothetical protein